MANTSIQKLYDIAKRSKETLRNYRAKEREATNGFVLRAGGAGAVLAGNVLAGALDGKYGNDEGEDGTAKLGPVPVNVGVGLIAMAVGIPGILPGSEYLALFGAGQAGYAAGKWAEKRVREGAAK